MSKASRQFKVPDALATLYDFVNSVDLRRFIDHGVQHQPSDALRSPKGLEEWMSEHGLPPDGRRMDPGALERALRLRSGLRAYLECDLERRRSDTAMLRALDAELRAFPVIVQASARNGIGLRPMMADARSGLSTVVAQFYDASASGALDRLKMCASEDCRRVFYDRSKPGTRRWCQAALCGNRMKTRNYRERQKRVS